MGILCNNLFGRWIWREGLIIDDWFIRLSDLKFLVWRLLYPQLDVYLTRCRESLKRELKEIIEEKGGSVIMNEERVLK